MLYLQIFIRQQGKIYMRSWSLPFVFVEVQLTGIRARTFGEDVGKRIDHDATTVFAKSTCASRENRFDPLKCENTRQHIYKNLSS